VNVATLEQRRGAAEDEVDMPGDERVLEILAAAVQENGVLPAEETRVPEHRPVAVDAERERLADRPGGVLQGQVLGGEVIGVDHDGRRPERADRLPVRSGHVGVQVEGDLGRHRILADQGEKPLLPLDIDQLDRCRRG